MNAVASRTGGIALASCFAIHLAASPARADCPAELRDLRAKLVRVKDPASRQEIAKLAEKAEKDDRKGRTRLCYDAIERAKSLIK